MRRRKDLLRAAAYLAAATLCLWYGVTGLRRGAVEDFSRGSGGIHVVHRATRPVLFWVCEGLWFVPECMSLWLFVSEAGGVWRDSPRARAAREADRARRTAAQVRGVEAGEGPDPPWVRFPDESAAVSEDALTAYLEGVFVPFWEPLGAPARAAFLRRNPPPNAEWREVMEEWAVPEWGNADQEAEARAERPRLIGLALAVVACQLAGIQALERVPTRAAPPVAPSQGPVPAPVTSTGKAAAKPRPRMTMGDYARIVCSPDSSCVAAASEQDERDIAQAERRKSGTGAGQASRAEKEALKQALKQALGRAYRIKSGTNAVFFGAGTGAAGADVSHVYFEVGPHCVMEGWIPSGWLRKQPAPR